MRTELVEIYSDTTNAAIIRHPGRRFPGILVQGDTLCALCSRADQACREARSASVGGGLREINELRNVLWGLLTRYKATLAEHDLPLPFDEVP